MNKISLVKKNNPSIYAAIIILFCSVIVLSACDIPLIRHYEGEVKKNSDIAILYHRPEMGWRISKIDGKAIVVGITTWSAAAGVDEIHLLNGKHKVVGRLLVTGNRFAVFSLEYDFKAGQKYQLSYKNIGEVVGNRVVISIEKADDNSDKKTNNIYIDDSELY